MVQRKTIHFTQLTMFDACAGITVASRPNTDVSPEKLCESDNVRHVFRGFGHSYESGSDVRAEPVVDSAPRLVASATGQVHLGPGHFRYRLAF